MSDPPRFRSWVATLLVAWAVFAASALFSPGNAAPKKGDPEAGKKLFKDKCVACHKPNGKGGVKITGNPTPDWTDPKRLASLSAGVTGWSYDDYLRDCITNGRPKSGMVAWSKQGVKPAQIEDLIAYVRTFSEPKNDKK